MKAIPLQAQRARPTTVNGMNLPRFLTRFLALFVATCLGSPSASFAQTSATPLELMVLGSGGPGATGRAASCYLVLIDGTPRILVDAAVSGIDLHCAPQIFKE